MDIKNNIVLEIEKEGNMFYFSMPVGAPYGQAYDAILESLEKVQELSDNAVKNIREQREQQKEESEEKQEETGE